MIWLAYLSNDKVIGEVEAPDLDIARARAWARWGVSVDRVQSKVSAEVSAEEVVRPRREDY
jgi:hypothetical protein